MLSLMVHIEFDVFFYMKLLVLCFPYLSICVSFFLFLFLCNFYTKDKFLPFVLCSNIMFTCFMKANNLTCISIEDMCYLSGDHETRARSCPLHCRMLP